MEEQKNNPLWNAFQKFIELDKSKFILQWDDVRISNVMLSGRFGLTEAEQLLKTKRTVYSLQEGERFSFLIQLAIAKESFMEHWSQDIRLVLLTRSREITLPQGIFDYICYPDEKSVAVISSDGFDYYMKQMKDEYARLRMIVFDDEGTQEFTSDPFLLLSDREIPDVHPREMFFLEAKDYEDRERKDEIKPYYGFSPSRQALFSPRLVFENLEASSACTIENLEFEFLYKNDKGEVLFSRVANPCQEEGALPYVADFMDTKCLPPRKKYTVQVLFLGKVLAEADVYIGRRMAGTGSGWRKVECQQVSGIQRTGMETLHSMIGLESVKKEVERTMNYMRLMMARSKAGLPCNNRLMHIVMTGNPGTGKTTVARLMGSVFKQMGYLSKGHLVEANRESLLDSIIGGTEKKTREMIDKAKGGVLFIDEAYSLIVSENDDKDFGVQVINTLMPVLSDPDSDLVVILAGYDKEMEHLMKANPGLASRFPVRLHFPDYTIGELMDIAHRFFKDNCYELMEGVQERMETVFREAVKQKGFSNGRFVMAFIQNVILPQMGCRIAALLGDEGCSQSVLTDILPEDVPVPGEVLTALGLGCTQTRTLGFR